MKQPPVIMRLFASCTRLWNGVTATAITPVPETASAELIRAASEIQTSPIFRCPDELFSEILSHFPVLRWADIHYLSIISWREIPEIYEDRVKVLLALSATCRAMRFKFLPEAWENTVMCPRMFPLSNRVPSGLQLQCRTLMGNPRIAAYVRVMTVSLMFNRTEKSIKDFARCLSGLPNLHTLEITYMGSSHSRFLRAGLKSTLPQIRTASLPSAAHHILRHCPNIEDLTCSPGGPNEDFFESLAVGKLNLRRFGTLFPGEADGWTRLAKICPQIKELSFTHRVYTLQDSRRYITALKSLSTIRLVNYLETPIRCCCTSFEEEYGGESGSRRLFVGGSEEAWEEVKKLAREHLKDCDSSGPKTLKTMALTDSELSGVEYLEPEEEFSI